MHAAPAAVRRSASQHQRDGRGTRRDHAGAARGDSRGNGDGVGGAAWQGRWYITHLQRMKR